MGSRMDSGVDSRMDAGVDSELHPGVDNGNGVNSGVDSERTLSWAYERLEGSVLGSSLQ